MIISLLTGAAQTADWSGAETMSAVRGIVATVFVLGLLGLLAWMLRRGTLRLGPGKAGQVVKVETAVSLGDRRSVVVIAVEGRRLLLGLSPTEVAMLTELTPAAAGAPVSFDNALQSAVRGPKPEAGQVQS
jgi:flagellar biosynthetic protein FliO